MSNRPKLPPLEVGQCTCDETVLWDEQSGRHYRVERPRFHSCRYIALVNDRVAEAAGKAFERAQSLHPADAEARRTAYMRIYAELMRDVRFGVLTYMQATEKSAKAAAPASN